MSSWMTSLVVWGVSIYRGRTGETPAFRYGEEPVLPPFICCLTWDTLIV